MGWVTANIVSSLAAFQQGQEGFPEGGEQPFSDPLHLVADLAGDGLTACGEAATTLTSPQPLKRPSLRSELWGPDDIQQGRRTGPVFQQEGGHVHWVSLRVLNAEERAPDFNDTTSPHPLLSPEGTFEKDDCSSFDCRPDLWQRPLLAESSILYGFRTG